MQKKRQSLGQWRRNTTADTLFQIPFCPLEKYNDDDDDETAEYWNDSSIYAFDAELSDVTAVVPVTDVEMQVEEEGGVVEEAQEEEEEEEVDSGAASAVSAT